MNPGLSLLIIIGYFSVLLLISRITGRKADTQTFFTANRNSPWYVVAFGMIGATLSGVTFISVPGAVGNGNWSYMQMVLGYLPGYAFIALVLLPLYYRLGLTSIYGYLKQRFGLETYRSGALLFLVSRIIGASLRLWLVARVLHIAVIEPLAPSIGFLIPFELTVLISIALIYIYTFRGGINTVVWTDTLQTLCMLLAAGTVVWMIGSKLELDAAGIVKTVRHSDYSQVFVWDWRPGNNFFKQFVAGALIAIVMTGLDQDMMQKNLTCRTVGESQKNMFWFSVVLVFANLLFLSLGALLYIYGSTTGFAEPVFVEDCKVLLADPASAGMVWGKTDDLFAWLSLNYLGPVAGTLFVLGVIAAAYSSADSALTALTTSFCVDILDFEQRSDERQKQRIRYRVHIGFAAVLFVVIVIFQHVNDDAVIWEIFRAAGYTYGPLLGLYVFGMFSRWEIRQKWVPYVVVIAPILTYLIQKYSPALIGYSFGFEILLLNAILTYAGLALLIRHKPSDHGNPEP